MSLIAAAPASSARLATLGLKGVGAHRDAGAPRQPLDGGDEPRSLLVRRDRRAAAGRHRPHVEKVESRLGQRQAVRHRTLRRHAARPLEERVGGDVDDPGRQRRREGEHAIGKAPAGHLRPNVARPVPYTVAPPCRCAASTPTSTAPCWGATASLFRDAEGTFSLTQARALEACHRAEVEVVIMSGRREAQVMAVAALLAQTSYIYEAGCGGADRRRANTADR